jgi:uncharacterized protein YjlB
VEQATHEVENVLRGKKRLKVGGDDEGEVRKERRKRGVE